MKPIELPVLYTIDNDAMLYRDLVESREKQRMPLEIYLMDSLTNLKETPMLTCALIMIILLFKS